MLTKTVQQKAAMNLLLFMTRGMSLRDWQQNGSLQRELALYAALAEHGIKTGVISWGGQADMDIARPFPWLKVYANRLSLPQNRYERLIPLLHAPALIHADIIKSNQMYGAETALRCAEIWKKPFIARCGYLRSLFCEKENSEHLPHEAAVESRVFTSAQAAVTTTEEDCRYIVKQYDLPPEKVHCIPNYVPDSFYTAEPADPQDIPIITQVGRLVPQKNLFALVRACSGLNVQLRLIGEGEEREALTEYAAECGISLEITGNVSHERLPRILAESTVCTLVSHFEGHPKALLEYMACGRPVLTTDVPGITPLIEHGKTGMLCKSDADSIRQSLQTILADAGLRQSLGKNAREYAKRFSLEQTVAKELQLYRSLPETSPVHSALHGTGRMATAAGRLASRKLQKVSDRLKHRHKPAPASVPVPVPAPLNTAMNDEEFAAKCVADIQAYISSKTPSEALKILFSIDEKLYATSGWLAVAYDGGVHTKHRHTRYHDFFFNRLSPGETVLDIGCGNGFLAYDMAEKGKARVTGIDISPENIAMAKERFAHPNVAYTVGNALVDIPSGSFKTVVLSNVLEHLPDRPAFLRGILQKLQPERLLIRVPLFERDWRVPLKKEFGLEWRLDPTHETEYTLESFTNEIHAAGLMLPHMEIRWSEIWCEATPAAAPSKNAPRAAS